MSTAKARKPAKTTRTSWVYFDEKIDKKRFSKGCQIFRCFIKPIAAIAFWELGFPRCTWTQVIEVTKNSHHNHISAHRVNMSRVLSMAYVVKHFSRLTVNVTETHCMYDHVVVDTSSAHLKVGRK